MMCELWTKGLRPLITSAILIEHCLREAKAMLSRRSPTAAACPDPALEFEGYQFQKFSYAHDSGSFKFSCREILLIPRNNEIDLRP